MQHEMQHKKNNKDDTIFHPGADPPGNVFSTAEHFSKEGSVLFITAALMTGCR